MQPQYLEYLAKRPETSSEKAAAGFADEWQRQVTSYYPAMINAYYRRLAEEYGEPIQRMVYPDAAEINGANRALPEDPVGEDRHSPVPNLTHRYRDRVLMLVSDSCPVYCRFCTRKRKVGRTLKVTNDTVEAGLDYIRSDSGIRDVLLSGGDPLMLPVQKLDSILQRVRAIKHVEVIRIGTRVPAAMPELVTRDLAHMLAGHHPLYMHTHFDHPAELTDDARRACSLLADAGLPLANQSVLLKGVNNDAGVLEELFRGLLRCRVRPYYLFQVDMVRGADHFRTPLLQGISIMEELHERTSPMALPRFAVDLPGGLGKVFPVRESVLSDGGRQCIRLPGGELVPYADPVQAI